MPSKKNAITAPAPEPEIALPAPNGDKDNLPGNVNDKIRQLIRQGPYALPAASAQRQVAAAGGQHPRRGFPNAR